jgi:hypothetical protein
MLPLSWAVALAVAAVIVLAVAHLAGTSARELMRTGSLWPLVVILPALCLGKTLGLVCANLLALAVPSLRRILDQECRETGRNGFAVATTGLLKAMAAFGVGVLVAVVVFVRFHGR